MGEFAKRLSDGAEIKIGTCEEMLYLRFEDRAKVSALPGSVDVNNPEHACQLLYRLPFPDEDSIAPGDYKEPFRRQRLYDSHGDEYKIPALVGQPGMMQLRHEASGLLLNVLCYYGLKLPDVGTGITALWNGKGWSLELAFLRAVYEDCRLILFPVVQCRHCRKCWRTSWSDVWDFVPEPLREKLKLHALAGIRRELEKLESANKGAA